jgi:2-polyprenyl-3-methyl-5-hydroxy-6-metoxy-1,4-benzoquinol methylase
LAHLPFLAAKQPLYDRSFFEYQDHIQSPVYEALADALYACLRPRSVVDVGCGTGFLLERFAMRGATIRGLEGSRHAIALSPVADSITRCNLERGVPRLGRFDLCLCIEVAEHLPARTARTLVRGLTELSDVVVFTAATPGQGGAHHINLRPKSFWTALFDGEGFARSELAVNLRSAIDGVDSPAWWIRENLTVFERRSPGGPSP